MIKVCIFDIGNVVWIYKPLYNQIFNSWAQILNLPYDQFWQEYTKVYEGFETGQLELKDWTKKLNPSINPNLFDQKLTEIFGNKKSVNSYFNQEILNLIDLIKKSDIKVGCLSNAENFFYPDLYQKYFEPLFDFSILSWREKERKPNLNIYQKIFQYGDWQPQEVIFIDDKEKNVLAANQLGINSILYLSFDQLEPQISELLPQPIII